MKVNLDHSARFSKFLFQVFLIVLIIIYACPNQAVSQITGKRSGDIKIGLLIPDDRSVAAIQGAELAIRKANEKGGPDGLHFQIVVRSMEGPWGTGSKEAVSLIFDEKVRALLGSHDGRNAHIVEQAATKSIVIMMSAWSSDPTLSQAFVPWFFNCVPNDNQQAASLFKEIYEIKKYWKIAVINGSDYDSQMTLKSFLRITKTPGRPDPVLFNYDDPGLNRDELPDLIKNADADCVVIFCQPGAASKIAGLIRKKNMNLPLFGSLRILDENELSANEIQVFNNILSVPSGSWQGPEYNTFRDEFRKTFNKTPGMVASYSYDGTNALIEAIRSAGINDREMMQKSLKEINFRGVTGQIQFDDKGNRTGVFVSVRVNNGVPAGSN